MKRFALAALVLVGCRTLVGIDDLEPAPPDGGNGQQNQGDGGDPTKVCTSGGDCRQCCKKTFSQLAQAIVANGSRCFCSAATCADKCSTATGDGGSACDLRALDPQNPNADAAAAMPCIQCEDQTLTQLPLSNDCSDLCGGDTECSNGLRCLQSCH